MSTLKETEESELEELSSSPYFYKTLIDNSFDGIGITNDRGENLYQSPAVTRTFQYFLI